MERIYMDHNSTTPVHPAVLEAMSPYHKEKYGNASSLHSFGHEAQVAMEEAREKIAEFIGAQSTEIIFTSGGTESDDIAILGSVSENSGSGNHIITCAIEHQAVLNICKHLETHGSQVSYLPVDRYGMVDPDDIRKAITSNTALITIMHANNEIGNIEPIQEISEIAKERGVIFHTDAAQSLGKVPIDVNELGVDLLSMSAHKIYGPKGIGALYIRTGVKVKPLVGGHHERGLRAGTENIPAIVGFGKAIEIVAADMEAEGRRLWSLTEKLRMGLQDQLESVSVNGHPTQRLPGTINLSFDSLEGQSIVHDLDVKGVAVSTGAACTCSLPEPSHVPMALGLPPSVAKSAIRFSLGRGNTEADVDYVLRELPPVIRHLKETSKSYDAEIPGLEELWAKTLGDPRVRVAILDGPVDQSHPSLVGAKLTQIRTLVSSSASPGPALQHGTHVASVIFGQHGGPVKGIASGCSGLIVPIFKDKGDGSIAPCSQVDLARGIMQAIQGGAHIINISGGEFSHSGTAHPLLANAVRSCADNGVLIVAAAGNEGCDCLHIPGALPSVLAIGAMDSQGLPLESSNWGNIYRTQGILAPGEGILGANSAGGTIVNSGTSFATPLVSGIAALLLSLQLKLRQKPDPQIVREALLSSVLGCDYEKASDCRRFLAGRLNISGALSSIMQGVDTMQESNNMSDQSEVQENDQCPVCGEADVKSLAAEVSASATQDGARTVISSKASRGALRPSSAMPPGSFGTEVPPEQDLAAPSNTTCTNGCGPNATSVQLVYALGMLGYDFGTEARRDSIMQHMMGSVSQEELPNPHSQLLAYLDDNPWDAQSIYWTLNLDATTIYAIVPQGAFAFDCYKRLREFLNDQVNAGAERVSVPGYIVGKVMLMSGQVVPVISPELRGMHNWKTSDLVNAVCGAPPNKNASLDDQQLYMQGTEGIANFLTRVYDELRNLGVASQERAINYAATNAFNIAQVFESTLKERMELDAIELEPSPICRPGSDCWDVKLTFFNPRRAFIQARKVYCFTVDVTDVVPVMVGPMRSWSMR